jgi:radical SAM-linked protein
MKGAFVEYARHGAAAWLAHLDTMRLFERALARAEWPVAWSTASFNPRPQVVFGLPVGLGVETCRDPVLIMLEHAIDLDRAARRLNEAFPPGVRLTSWAQVDVPKKSLMARVVAARYRLEAPGIERAFRRTFADGRDVVVERVRKHKRSLVHLTPRIYSLDEASDDAIIVTVGAGSVDHLRIDLLMDAMVRDGGFARDDALGARITRERVYLDDVPTSRGIIV